jgi:LPXTG-motif cell wall-anchored protein
MHRSLLAGCAALAVVVAGVVGLSSVAGAATASIAISPASVPQGGQVSMGGTCDANTSGFLLSQAFIGHTEFAGVPAVAFTTNSAGRFFVTFHINKAVTPAVYSVTGRCGGGNMGITVHVKVTAATESLPTTGSSSSLLVGAAVSFLLAGLVLFLFGRKRPVTG